MSSPWSEVGDGILIRRYSEPFDHNVGLVLGNAGVLVVDTSTNPARARALQAEIRSVTSLPVEWVFNTHEHWDHTFGNQEFAGARIWGHVECRRRLLALGDEVRNRIAGQYPSEPSYREVVITPPTETFADEVSLDLGGRRVELAFYGLGHTSNDAVLHVDGVTFAGDLVEEGGPPTFDDSYPISWVETIGLLAEAAGAVVIPGHGSPVDPEYLVMARFDLAWLARTAATGVAAGTPVREVSTNGSPYPEGHTRVGLERAYAELVSS